MATVARARIERATLASISIHALVALAIPALAWTSASVTPVETVSFSHVLRVVITPPRAPHPLPRAVAPRHAVIAKVNFTRNVRMASIVPHRHSSPAPVVATDAPAAPAVGSVQQAGSGSVNGNGVPQATPSPQVRAIASVGTHQTGGYLPFGAEQPDPVLDPGVRKQLDALGTHVTLIVAVGDDGRTESVSFEPPVDAQLEERIRNLLADASWDPAVCGGGVNCAGKAVIRL
jgi:hypothetical protein